MTEQQTGNKRKAILLMALMAIVAITVAGVTLVVLYQAAWQSQQMRLGEMAKNQAKMLEVIAQQRIDDNPNLPAGSTFQSTIKLMQEAGQHFQGFGESGGEFTLGRLKDNRIEILLNKRHNNNGEVMYVEQNTNLAQPMRRALAGKSGVMTGLDYDGVEVLAAYEPVNIYQLGLVAKINLAEFKKPFIRAGIIAALVGSIFILIGSLLFRRISTTMIRSAEESELQLDVILDTVVDGIVTIDENGSIASYNSAAERIFGHTAKDAIGQNINFLIPEHYHQQHDQHMKNHTNKESSRIFGMNREVTGLRKDGSTFPMDLAVSHTVIGKSRIFTGIVRDITQRKQTEKELEQYREHLEDQVKQRTQALEKANIKLVELARKDSLTGISNRRVLDNVLTQEIRRASRDATPIAFLLCDIDYFKNYNDTYGHLAGDSSLVKVAKAINNSFQRAGDLVARYGGEEFAVILPNTNTAKAKQLAEALLKTVWNLNLPHKTSHITDRVTISIGVVSVTPNNGYNNDMLIKAADDALYKAKELGRNRVFVSADPASTDNVIAHK